MRKHEFMSKDLFSIQLTYILKDHYHAIKLAQLHKLLMQICNNNNNNNNNNNDNDNNNNGLWRFTLSDRWRYWSIMLSRQ